MHVPCVLLMACENYINWICVGALAAFVLGGPVAVPLFMLVVYATNSLFFRNVQSLDMPKCSSSSQSSPSAFWGHYKMEAPVLGNGWESEPTEIVLYSPGFTGRQAHLAQLSHECWLLSDSQFKDYADASMVHYTALYAYRHGDQMLYIHPCLVYEHAHSGYSYRALRENETLATLYASGDADIVPVARL